MLLAIDAGNTNVEFAIFENNHLCAQWRACSSLQRTPDEWASWLIGLMKIANINHTKINKSIISCVVPSLLDDLADLCRLHFGHHPLIVGQDSLTLGIDCEVGDATEVGADLLVTCVAAKKLCREPALILDMGTATTLSLLNHHGNFAGVAIAPGLSTSMRALTDGAARLPQISWAKTDRVIGTTTTSAIQGGVYWGYIGLLENMIWKAKEQYLEEHPEAEIKVIATGGLACYVVDEINLIDIYEPDLSLKGLQIIAENNVTIEKYSKAS
jgi:type III pantothenate kinase